MSEEVCLSDFEKLREALTHYIYAYRVLHELDHLCRVHKDDRACDEVTIAFSRWESADRNLKYAFKDLSQCIKKKCRCEG